MRCLLTALLALLTASAAEACVMMLPREPELPPLELKKQHVTVTIDNQVALTKVDQVFANNTHRELEATYVFPLPKGASVTEFALWINGQRQKAEMMEKEKARGIYEAIVRQRKDPGLLEYLGEELFQARVYPIPARGEQRVEISFTQALTMDAGVAEYRYPLKALAGSPPQELVIEAKISSSVPIKSVYSPSHSVAVKKTDDHSATASMEQAKVAPTADFSLLLTTSEKDFGLNLLCSRRKGEDGYFMLMLAPKQSVEASAVVTRDLCFVLDTSGSMQGEKIKQAREAMKFCVRALNKGDRFNVLKFSTDVEAFSPKLDTATPEREEQAVAWIDRLEATGGTAIDDAMAEALRQLEGGTRPAAVVFMTDGKPTVGTSDPDRIVKNVAEKNSRRARVFALGVGEDLNAKLLDRMAEDNGGVPVYISPGEDIEVKVSGFYSKISQPVLTDLALDFGTMKVKQVYPSKLPDLYQGSQLVVYGRYEEGGDATVKLTGTINDKKVEHAYPAKFAAEELEREFIPRLWATRRVGYLLDEIRKNGEQAELRDEVIQLAKKYGIVTPYTSYLVVEDEAMASVPSHRADREGRQKMRMQPYVDYARGGAAPAPSAAPQQAMEAFQADAGAGAVAASKAVQELKRAEAAAPGPAAAVSEKSVDGKTFKLENGVWTDTAYKAGMPELRIQQGSAAYFDLVMAHQELKKALALGEKVIVVVGEKALVIAPDGKTTVTPEEMQAFFGK